MQLMKHQIKAVEFLDHNKGVGALYHEVGTGKTISALSTYQYFRHREAGLKLFVICPLSLIEGAWIKELSKFAPDLRWHDMHGNTQNFKGKHAGDVYIINFEYLISENKFTALKQFLSYHQWMCVIDESSKMKNNQAKTTERILDLAQYFKHRVLMSGTPAPNIEWEYWAQMTFLSPEIFGPSFHRFKNIYFTLRRGKQAAPGAFMNKAALRELFKQGYKYDITPANRQKMLERMRPFCDFVAARDCIDLPDEVDEYRIVEMRPEQEDAYDTMKELCVLELKESQSFAVANMALTKLMKLRQITSGFVIDEDGKQVDLLKINPKMDALAEVIEECGDKQMIIWCQFHWEIDKVAALLQEFGGGISMLHGRVAQGNRIMEIENFINGKHRFLIAHPDSAAHGLTFTNCHVQVFYSLSYSFEEYSQSRGRTMRYGQKNNCLYFHLLCKGTIDEDVLAILQKKATGAEIAEKYLKGT